MVWFLFGCGLRSTVRSTVIRCGYLHGSAFTVVSHHFLQVYRTYGSHTRSYACPGFHGWFVHVFVHRCTHCIYVHLAVAVATHHAQLPYVPTRTTHLFYVCVYTCCILRARFHRYVTFTHVTLRFTPFTFTLITHCLFTTFGSICRYPYTPAVAVYVYACILRLHCVWFHTWLRWFRSTFPLPLHARFILTATHFYVSARLLVCCGSAFVWLLFAHVGSVDFRLRFCVYVHVRLHVYLTLHAAFLRFVRLPFHLPLTHRSPFTAAFAFRFAFVHCAFVTFTVRCLAVWFVGFLRFVTAFTFLIRVTQDYRILRLRTRAVAAGYTLAFTGYVPHARTRTFSVTHCFTRHYGWFYLTAFSLLLPLRFTFDRLPFCDFSFVRFVTHRLRGLRTHIHVLRLFPVFYISRTPAFTTARRRSVYVVCGLRLRA